MIEHSIKQVQDTKIWGQVLIFISKRKGEPLASTNPSPGRLRLMLITSVHLNITISKYLTIYQLIKYRRISQTQSWQIFSSKQSQNFIHWLVESYLENTGT